MQLAVGVVVDREAERAWVEIVSANFFDVLGVPVILGRSFAVSDDAPASPAAVDPQPCVLAAAVRG